METRKSNPVGWFEIYVDDIERAKKFYGSVFQTQFTKIENANHKDEMQMWGFPMDEGVYGSSGALVKMEGVPAGCGGTLIYFHSKDCAIEEALIEKAGGKVFKAKAAIGEYGHFCLAFDTEGNMFGIHSIN